MTNALLPFPVTAELAGENRIGSKRVEDAGLSFIVSAESLDLEAGNAPDNGNMNSKNATHTIDIYDAYI